VRRRIVVADRGHTRRATRVRRDPPPVGGRAHLRLAHRAPPPGPRLPTRPGRVRSHDPLGRDQHHHPAHRSRTPGQPAATTHFPDRRLIFSTRSARSPKAAGYRCSAACAKFWNPAGSSQLGGVAVTQWPGGGNGLRRGSGPVLCRIRRSRVTTGALAPLGVRRRRRARSHRLWREAHVPGRSRSGQRRSRCQTYRRRRLRVVRPRGEIARARSWSSPCFRAVG
jgi:hypothetical protein